VNRKRFQEKSTRQSHFTSHILPFTIPSRSPARLIALLTVQHLSKMLGTSFCCQDPRSIRHRWLVAHMLTMAALEIGHPIADFVHVISHNGLLHSTNLPHIPVIDSIDVCYTRARGRMLTQTEEHA
jgi:hypothetical protein